MKRRLISQRDSLTLTLPKEWVKGRNLTSKDEIEIIVDRNSLIINSDKKESKKEFTLNVSDYSESFIRNLLNQAYMLSATKITINSNKKSKLILCEKLNSLFLVGFEVTEKTENKIVLELLTSSSKEHLDQFILKIFNFLDSNFIFLKEKSVNKNKDILEEIKRDTKKISQYKNICKRILLNDPTNNISNKLLLEVINYLTEINHLIFHLIEGKTKLNIKLIEELEEIFTLVKKAYFKKDINLIDELQGKINKIDTTNNQIIYSIVRNLYNLSNSIIAHSLNE